MKKTLYEILQIPADASDDQILAAYRKLMEQNSAEASDPNGQVLIKEAYSILSRPQQRAAYDASLVMKAQPRQLAASEEATSSGPAGRWLLWSMIAIGLATAIYAWQARKSTKPAAATTTDRVVFIGVPDGARSTQPGSALAQKEKSPEELFSLLAGSVAMVGSLDAAGKLRAQGSGVVIDRGVVITNCHVTKDGSQFQVKLGGEIHSARLDTADEEFDLCRLSVPGLSAPGVAVASVASLRTGQKVYAIGAPHGLELTISDGMVSSLRETEMGTFIQTTAPISPGSSGGGLFNASGQLVGIVTFYHRFGQNLNFAVPADWIGQMRDRTSLASKESNPAADEQKKVATAIDPDGSISGRILGRWHCFRPAVGRHVDLEFLRGGEVVGAWQGKPIRDRYSVSGKVLYLYGDNLSLHIEEVLDRTMVLSTGKEQRIACDRTV